MKNNALGYNIKLLREQYPLTQIEFAKILNINNSTLSQYEAGNRMPSDEIKLKIADFFDVSVDFLLGRTTDKTTYTVNQDSHIPNSKVTERDENNDDLIIYNKNFEITKDELQLLELYRKLPITLKAELRGEIKGILRNTNQEQSAAIDNNGINSNKKII